MSDKDELSPKEQVFMEALFNEANGDITYAMELAGFPKTTSKTQLIAKLQTEILEATRKYLAGNAPLAIMSIISSLKDPTNPGVKNQLAAAKEILDRAGVVKEEKQTIDINQKVLFVLPAKDTSQSSLSTNEPKVIDLDKTEYTTEPS